MIAFPFQAGFSPAIKRQISIPAGIGSKEDLFDFYRREIPLPAYFGNNWDALEECLGDVALHAKESLGIAHQDVPLASSPSDRKLYLDILTEAVRSNSHFEVTFPKKDWGLIHSIRT